MAIIRKKELAGMSVEELQRRMRELKLELSKESASVAVGMPKNPGKIRESRKTIARILTLINQKSKAVKPEGR
jgi:large subunit ribosomal protein L29